jgi:hypothetical protein
MRGVQQLELVTTTACCRRCTNRMTWRHGSGLREQKRRGARKEPRHEWGWPIAARDHARAMGGTRSKRCRSSAGRRRPARDVSRDDLLWEEDHRRGRLCHARRLARGTRLRLIDLRGDACASLMVFNAEMPTERLNVADTVKVQWNAYLGAGKLLLSDMGRVLMSIVEDDAGTHDAFCGTSNAATNARAMAKAATAAPSPTGATACCWARPSTALAAATCTPASTCSRARGSRPTARSPAGRPLRSGPQRAAARRDGRDRGHRQLPARARPAAGLDRDPAAPFGLARPGDAPDDAIRNATPEGLRAFLNVEDYYRR